MTKKITYCGLLSSVAIILGYFENLFPPIIPVPGIKLGLANLAVVIALYLLSEKEALLISFVRILAVGFLFGNFSNIIYRLSGGLISLAFMIIFKKTNFFSIIGVSIVGGVIHNMAQIIVATFVIQNVKILYYSPILIISGIVTGFIIGLVSYWVHRNVKYMLHK